MKSLLSVARLSKPRPRPQGVRWLCATTTPPPAAETPPPPKSDVKEGAEGIKCGGFFFACDPNIGLWNDKINPNWRFTFTDSRSEEKQRIPFAFSTQLRGPHVECAVRFQFGFVQCDGAFSSIPDRFTVDDGWELSIPLPFSGVRFCHTILSATGVDGQPTPVTVYCVDLPLGFSAGFQKTISGVAVKGGVPEATWRNEVAMVVLICAFLWGLYNLVCLPSTWTEFAEELDEMWNYEDNPEGQMFDMLDFDGDGYITREDIRNFAREAKLPSHQFDPDQVFDALDTMRSGQVSFEEFEQTIGHLMQEMEAMSGGMQGMNHGMGGGFNQGIPTNVPGMPLGVGPGALKRGVDLQPFGGAFSPGAFPPRFPGQ